MSTAPATYNVPIYRKGAAAMANTINIPEIVRRVRALKALSKSTGFSTNRSVGELLDRLSPDDLVRVGEAFLLDSNQTTDNT